MDECLSEDIVMLKIDGDPIVTSHDISNITENINSSTDFLDQTYNELPEQEITSTKQLTELKNVSHEESSHAPNIQNNSNEQPTEKVGTRKVARNQKNNFSHICPICREGKNNLVLLID